MSGKEQPDHDQRLKTLVTEFFREFLFCFFAEWAERFDYDVIDWLPQEVFPDPPQGERRVLDLVCRLGVKPGVPPPFDDGADGGLVLVHVEVESNDRIAGFRRRFFEYYVELRRKYDLPVWPIGLFLRVGLDGVGWTNYAETFWGRRVLEYSFAYVGLPALDAAEYASRENLLGVALTSLMRVPRERRAELRAEALDQIIRSDQNEWRRFLLAEALLAYSDLDPDEWERLQALLVTDKYREARAMTLTYFERGKIQGQLEVAVMQLETKFGPLSEQAKKCLQELPPERLQQLLRDFAQGKPLQELGLED